MPHALAAAPALWLPCDGAAVSRTTYSALFAAIGTAYGAGDGSTTFNVPSLKGRVPVGYDSGQTEFNALNKSGGAKTHTLSTSEIPSHNHGVNDPGHAHKVHGSYITTGASAYIAARWDGGYADVGGIEGATTGITIQNAGGGGSHNNLQPYLTLNYAIYAGV